jgi:hypothetical protein
MGLSLNTRPQVLPEGEVRIGMSYGGTRDVGEDFSYSAPSAEKPPEDILAFLHEYSFHYGLNGWMDVGLRIRPFSNGAKLETLFQVLDEESDPLGLAIGLGLDGFSTDVISLGCEEGGCFYREYYGLAADLPVVISHHIAPSATVFLGIRYTHLFIEGEQRYESQTHAFDTLVVEKHISQPIFGWVAGLSFVWGIVRFVPQLLGTTYSFPNESLKHSVTFAFDFAFEF